MWNLIFGQLVNSCQLSDNEHFIDVVLIATIILSEYRYFHPLGVYLILVEITNISNWATSQAAIASWQFLDGENFS